MKNKITQFILCMLFCSVMSSCLDDLNTEPLSDQSINGANVLDTEEGYKQFLAKLYGSLTLTGQQGEFGDPELVNPDEGETSFLRTYWSAQELTTDEAISAWNGPDVQSLQNQNWTDNNSHLDLLYKRIYINIAFCNEYIRSVDERIGGLSGSLLEDVIAYRAEAITLRALFYYFAMDLWGNVPFILPEDGVGAYFPPQISRTDLFDHIESELLAALPDLVDAGQNEYARADKAMAWTLLSKMYLNAEVYTGQSRYDDCITYCNNVIGSNEFELISDYQDLFLADNHRHRQEIIFPVAEDGVNTRSYGGMTFVLHGATGDGPANGITGGWYGHRPTSSFVEGYFADVTGATDSRAIFETTGQTSLVIDDPIQFGQGYRCAKFKNITSGGADGQDPTFVDTDLPLFRLADVYLMYAEAVVRGGSGGSLASALTYVNELRERAYGNTSGNIVSGDLTLDFILAERGRELYWEAHRRTDLVRFGQLTDGNMRWDWKGGVQEGTAISGHRDVFPIPAFDLGLNKNLEQNDDY